MFERLVGKVVSNVLSKYVTEESLAENQVSQSAQLGIWSGYLTLQNLELQTKVINAKLQADGLPFEVVHGSIRQIEVTIPWSKLSSNQVLSRLGASSNNNGSNANHDDAAAVVVVVDGIHVLAQTTLDFDDDALREERIKQRRNQLTVAGAYVVKTEDTSSTEQGTSSYYLELLKQRISEGIFQEVADKIHVHVRNLHVRMEDTVSDPHNPYAFGLTMESMHLHYDDNSSDSDGNKTEKASTIVSKVAQINQLAIYWNVIDYGKEEEQLPMEHSVLCQTCQEEEGDSSGKLAHISRALNSTIARRANTNLASSPSRKDHHHIPTHTYLLLPVNGTIHLDLSTRPADLSSHPALSISVAIDPLAAQLRDVQCTQLLRLSSELKNHQFVKKYRAFRPRVSVHDNPRAWWHYAAKAIRYELKEGFLRWSWSRFASGLRIRDRYMVLYERNLRYPPLSAEHDDGTVNMTSGEGGSAATTTTTTISTTEASAPDAGAGPSPPRVVNDEPMALTRQERDELQQLEDGLVADLSVDDIIIYRALVRKRIGDQLVQSSSMEPPPAMRTSWWGKTIEHVTTDDQETEQEFERLLMYLKDASTASAASANKSEGDSQATAVSFIMTLEQVTLAIYSPLSITNEEHQLRRLHVKFIEWSIVNLQMGIAIKGDYATQEGQLSINDLQGTEIRADQSQHVVVSRLESESTSDDATEDYTAESQLLSITLCVHPESCESCDLEVSVFLNTLEVRLSPDCEWILHLERLTKEITKVQNVADYWRILSLAYVNSLAFDRLRLLAKAESASERHQKVDLDVTIQCPILRVGDGTGCDIIIDVGLAHLCTKSLAGVARQNLSNIALDSDRFDNRCYRSTARLQSPTAGAGSILSSTPSLAKTIQSRDRAFQKIAGGKRRHSVFSSATSVDSFYPNTHGNTSFHESMNIDDTLSFSRGFHNDSNKGVQGGQLDAVFYDEYELKLQLGRISFSFESELFDISSGAEVRSTILTCVLPTDHTLSRMKIHTVMGPVRLALNENVMFHAGTAISTWKKILDFGVVPSQARFSSGFNMLKSQPFTQKVALRNEIPINVTDEHEFFDANEGYDSAGDDHSAVWFEDTWISDAESWVDGESHSNSHDKRRRRRRSSSISDVSSTSDHSIKGRVVPHGSTYLSAENLARLEDVDEDDSTTDNGEDEDSFHSVLSPGVHMKLLDEFNECVDTREASLKLLEERLLSIGGVNTSEIRPERRALKLEIARQRLELDAILASAVELKQMLPENRPDQDMSINTGPEVANVLSRAHMAKSVMMNREKGFVDDGNSGCHEMTRGLKRKIIQGSFVVERVDLSLSLQQVSSSASPDGYLLFEQTIQQIGLALFHREDDTKVYFSVGQAMLAVHGEPSMKIPSRVLASGGNRDTHLPSHFPHLLTRTAEEKFIRGAIHKQSHSSTCPTTNATPDVVRLRLVFGDVEFSPSFLHLSPLVEFSHKLSRRLDVHVDKPTSATTHSIHETGAVKRDNPLYMHTAVRFTSVRLLLCQHERVNAALIISEAGCRFMSARSTTEKFQADLRCSNFQVIQISNLEDSQGMEMAGKRDPYNVLLSLRIRGEKVLPTDTGGWVVASNDVHPAQKLLEASSTVQNLHVSIKVNPMRFVASPIGMNDILKCMKELNRGCQLSSQAAEQVVSNHQTHPQLPVRKRETMRWRVDCSLKRVIVEFQPGINGSDPTEDGASSAVLAFSVFACAQESASKEDSLACKLALTEISVSTNPDDWPILEPFSCISEMELAKTVLPPVFQLVCAADIAQLSLSSESPLDEVTTMMQNYGWDSLNLQVPTICQVGFTAKVTQVRLNWSTPVACLLTDIAESFKSMSHGSESLGPEKLVPRSGFPSTRHQIEFHVLFENIEVQLLKETETRIASFDPLLSFTMSDVRLDFDQGEQTAVSVLIRNSSVFDLSSAKGIRVLGEDSSTNSDENPYFVRVKLYMDNHGNNQCTVRLEINWGRIQCIVVPTCLQSILHLNESVARRPTQHDRSDQGHVHTKEGTSSSWLGGARNVNLILSAHADAFECILSSKDVVSHVRLHDDEHIGVVALRWRASLKVAIAIDYLHESSVPWLTLNLDENFTHSDDIELFKSFSNRYLQGSTDRVGAYGKAGQRLHSAWTCRIGLSVSALQAIRTNITSVQMKPGAKTVGLSYKSVHRIFFKTVPPTAGEQWITNPIDLDLTYRATGLSVFASCSADRSRETQLTQLSHLLEVKADFIDVLLYVSQSEDGFTEAFKVTIKPVLEMMKRQDTNRSMETPTVESLTSASQEEMRSPSFSSLLQKACFAFKLKLEGLQVTCVPGGATRLTESPIIKFRLGGMEAGVGGTPVQTDPVAFRRSSRLRRTNSRNVLNGDSVWHMTAAGWIRCQLTGDYHNRRLVAWEPFVEPWVLTASFGVDLVKTGLLSPTLVTQQDDSPASDYDGHSITGRMPPSMTYGEEAADRLREFGRLFRAPFQTPSTAKRSQNLEHSHTDLTYLMLVSSARTSFLSILHPSIKSIEDKEGRLFMALPSKEALNWLSGFGFPGRMHKEQHHLLSERFATSVLISDQGAPLNINFTGALLENLISYMNSKESAPHLIRNDTGMALRLHEVLDTDRANQGEIARTFYLKKGDECPLSLKRAISQTCDPHRAFVHLELGRGQENDTTEGQGFDEFSFKVSAKIPVDTVGVHRYPLDSNLDKKNDGITPSGSSARSLGWIVVRVALRGGIKVVSVESPFILRSTADKDILCQIWDKRSDSLIWHTIVPKAPESQDQTDKCTVSVPADMVPSLNDGSFLISAMALDSSSILDRKHSHGVQVPIPLPFSSRSFTKGVIAATELTLPILQRATDRHYDENIHLTACCVRLGSFSEVKAAVDVPEQRMIFFRAPLVIKNLLALPISVQVRIKQSSQTSSVGDAGVQSSDNTLSLRYSTMGRWESLGQLDCGESVNWTGATSSEKVQIRVRFVGTDGDNSRRFPTWSSAVYIPSNETANKSITSTDDVALFAQMRVMDADGVPLQLSASLDQGTGRVDQTVTSEENIRRFSQGLASATRVVSIFAPYWIVDATSQNLEFFSGASIAGQLDKRKESLDSDSVFPEGKPCLGLAELLDNENFLNIPTASAFRILMIGDETSTRLTVRKGFTRESMWSASSIVSPWSEPIPIQSGPDSEHDITVSAHRSPRSDDTELRDFQRVLLRARISQAPQRFGGDQGTKLIHVVNRYSIVNETGRDIEILSLGQSTSSVIQAGRNPQPFHFDDTRPIQIRFKEFGWSWSGKVVIRMNRRELTMRLRHKIKPQAVIVSVEVLKKKNTPTSYLVVRECMSPFRLENHTMHPLYFGQLTSRLGLDEDKTESSMLLPYQSSDFAWDEPELRRKTIFVSVSNPVDKSDGQMLGRFQLDEMAPGTSLRVENPLFAGEIVADGPTRVLRFSDSSMPRLSSFSANEMTSFQTSRREPRSSLSTFQVVVKLTQGIGVSIVDWSPQELLYIRLDDLHLERKVDSEVDAVSLAVATIKVNNQLWVTPYPVLLKMGKKYEPFPRRRNRRRDAIKISWRRSLNNHGGYGNVTLLESVEVSSEPISIYIDGNLANLILRMANQLYGLSPLPKEHHESKEAASRDCDLRKVLHLADGTIEDDTEQSARKLPVMGVDGNLIATAAIAAKLKLSPLPVVSVQSGFNIGSLRRQNRRQKTESMAKAQQKFYVGKLKVSAAKADISWSGPLPGAMSSLLLRALTFEGLPVRLRAFSVSHAFGSADEHLQLLKSHYVSFWRALDILMGLTYNPTFLFRAVAYTMRETCAGILHVLSDDTQKLAKYITLPQQRNADPAVRHDSNKKSSLQILDLCLGPILGMMSTGLLAISSVALSGSSLLKYGRQTSNHLSAHSLVRSRNPRLFAQREGTDLLVEYVEGENAGKALLSRVRMGIHLGEGYLYHCEDVRLSTVQSHNLDSAPMILMVTLERVLLLNGKLDQDFCSVVWETMFTGINHVEILLPTLKSAYRTLVLWYFSDPEVTVSNEADQANKYSQSIVTGINVLYKRTMHIPHRNCSPLLSIFKTRQLIDDKERSNKIADI